MLSSSTLQKGSINCIICSCVVLLQLTKYRVLEVKVLTVNCSIVTSVSGMTGSAKDLIANTLSFVSDSMVFCSPEPIRANWRVKCAESHVHSERQLSQ